MVYLSDCIEDLKQIRTYDLGNFSVDSIPVELKFQGDWIIPDENNKWIDGLRIVHSEWNEK